jgi:hypothetical protein
VEAVVMKAVVALAGRPPPLMPMESAVRAAAPPTVEAVAPTVTATAPSAPAPGVPDGSQPEEHGQPQSQGDPERLHTHATHTGVSVFTREASENPAPG